MANIKVRFDATQQQVSAGDGTWLPLAFVAIHDDPDRPVRVLVEVEVDPGSGRPRARSVVVEGRGTYEVTSRDLRAPVATIVQEALPVAADSGPLRPAGELRDPPSWGTPRPMHTNVKRRLVADSARRQYLTEADLAEVARVYVEALQEGRPTAAAVAQARGVEEGTARNLVRRARQVGLLTQTADRQAGGELTVRARELLGMDEEGNA
ncbi:hypothetical protein [Nitriliruptor alkaliphilus]|uniref:hypothetical protein n=1 Tax=Nitriliruptor alkaliphilus TaxID=427918 RepID=UPI00069921FF|nr:hypothetical protein [Nitriliruptor alkaliphilus]